MSRPTVLVAIKGLGLGGAERLISEGARHWRREVFDYHVAYGLPWKNQLVGDLTSLGVPVHLIGGKRGLSPFSVPRLRDTIKSVGAQLVHAHLPMMGVLSRLASPVPVVYTEHNLANSYRLPTRIANRLTYSRNRAVSAVSDQVADSLANYPGPTPTVIPNGVECAVTDLDAAKARLELGIRDDTPLIVHVGNIRPHKGHTTLIKAADEIKARSPAVVIASIGGEKYPHDIERLQSLAEQAGVSTTIRFLGRRPDALHFIAAADVFVNPSDVEGLPLVVLEAMCVGTPVVATSVGGVPSVIRHGETGLLVRAQQPAELAAAVFRILDHPDDAARYSSAAAALIRDAYSLERMVRAQEAMYLRVLND